MITNIRVVENAFGVIEGIIVVTVDKDISSYHYLHSYVAVCIALISSNNCSVNIFITILVLGVSTPNRTCFI